MPSADSTSWFLLRVKIRFILLKIDVVFSFLGGTIRLYGLSVWSSLVRRTNGKMIGYNIGFMPRLTFPEQAHLRGVSYPLSSKALNFEHINQPNFKRSMPGIKECCDAFTAATCLISGVI